MGIISGAVKAQPGQPGAAPGQQAQPAGGAMQEGLQRVVVAAMKALYDKTTGPQIIEMVKAAQDPLQGLAQAAYTVITQFAKISRGTMPLAVMLQAAKVIMAMIAEMAEAAGIIEDKAQVKDALPMLMELIKGGQGGAAQGATPAPPGAMAQPEEQPAGV